MSGIRSLAVVIVLSLLTITAYSQTVNPPKREFRGVWIATVANIDWPSKPGLPSEQQKKELIEILDEHQKSGINSIFLQVRPATDAIYAKGCGCEPWSRFLTGNQDTAPFPYYDPLEFAIKEAHKRGMELHAWFNPYRATTDLVDSHVSPNHITRRHPEWFFTYGGKKLFNPGLPAVRDYIVNVIMDVVKNYDIDGVHFDDYFYPYPEGGKPIPDADTYHLFGKGFNNIADWRRHNVDTLIKTLSDSIRHTKRHIKFGISPFGIWRNKSKDPAGSETRGLEAYSTLYADSRKWVEKGWIDYINPQVYFPFFYPAAPFEKLVDWWSDNAFGRHLYIGQGAYRAIENREGWRDKQQIPNQIRYIRDNARVQGSVYFSSVSLRKNFAGLRDSLRQDFYQYPSLQPQMLWLDDVPPQAPLELQASRIAANQVILHWSEPLKARDGETAYGYVVYRFKKGEKVDIENPKNILKISFDSSTTSFTDENALPDADYLYTVTAIDRLKNESVPSNIVQVETKDLVQRLGAEKVSP